MVISCARQPLAPPSLCLDGVALRWTSSAKLLGVTLDAQLRFSAHVGEVQLQRKKTVLSRARRQLGFCLRVTKGAGPETLRHLFTALVLPQLEYCCPIWSPHQEHLVAALESVQRRAAYATLVRRRDTRIARYREMRTADLLQAVGWNPLALRREVASLRLLTNLLILNSNQSGVVLPLRKNRTGSLQPILARTERHRQSFVVRTVTHWRSLPPSFTLCPPTARDEVKDFCHRVTSHLRHSLT
ncbi:uncharacterized protein LOC115315808 [Ixodes scapularis]|uniref:uncharacterized protein LOC115315808 n=1 Tax=Ixodes scapularis TaxID=6945 RepID=UPI0011617E01|nr:uncharacterized protein LOC115315808 [Ixodes scapularis]